jgi:hypothetical protein
MVGYLQVDYGTARTGSASAHALDMLQPRAADAKGQGQLNAAKRFVSVPAGPSTGTGEDVQSPYCESTRAVMERNGGTVEKFMGDAVDLRSSDVASRHGSPGIVVEVQREGPTTGGRAERFTGDVWIDAITQAQGPSSMSIGPGRTGLGAPPLGRGPSGQRPRPLGRRRPRCRFQPGWCSSSASSFARPR